MKPDAYLVLGRDGYRALSFDRHEADKLAAANYGAVWPLVKSERIDALLRQVEAFEVRLVDAASRGAHGLAVLAGAGA